MSFTQRTKLKLRKLKSLALLRFESRTILNCGKQPPGAGRRLRYYSIQFPHFADKQAGEGLDFREMLAQRVLPWR